MKCILNENQKTRLKLNNFTTNNDAREIKIFKSYIYVW